MTTETSIEVLGIKAALRELNQMSNVIRRQVTKEYKTVVAPMIDDAKNKIPTAAPLSGWGRNWTTKSGAKLLPWSGDKAKKLLKPGVSGKQPKEFNGRITNLAVFYVRWQGAIDTIFDMAGRGKSNTMADNLTAKYGRPSRVMYPAFEAHKHEIISGVETIVDGVAKLTNRNLKATS